MKVGIAQVNVRIGDLPGNAATIRAAVEEAADADVVVFPEMVLPGYPPRDLLLDDGFVDACGEALQGLATTLRGAPPVVVGTVVRAPSRSPGHPGLYDVAVVLHDGGVAAQRAKRLLPPYGVFHEPRWFLPGPAAPPVRLGGRSVGLLVCEDLWDEGYPVHPPAELRAAGAEVLLCLSASPYRRGILPERLHHARRAGLPIVHVNAVGGQDELIFDGQSFALAAGEPIARAAAFAEDVRVVDLDAAPALPAPRPWEADVRDALVLGIRDFCWKNGLRDAWLGLSGGVDSALVAVLAAEALGPEHVHALALPSRHTDPRSTEAARALADGLGLELRVLPLEPLHAAAEALLAPLLHEAPPGDTTAENVQARLRMLLLTAHLNRHGGVLLNTSNKTELTLGYGTLYGDLAGSLSPLGDLPKTDVYALARFLAAGGAPIPAFILDRPPTAELRPGQVDPFDYARVAPAAEALVHDAVPEGLSAREAADLRRRYRSAEHKRWQHGVVLKLTDRAFGTDRMFPITRG